MLFAPGPGCRRFRSDFFLRADTEFVGIRNGRFLPVKFANEGDGAPGGRPRSKASNRSSFRFCGTEFGIEQKDRKVSEWRRTDRLSALLLKRYF